MGSGQSYPTREEVFRDGPKVPMEPGAFDSAEKRAEFDRVSAKLPLIIDDESRRQVEDYKQACDNGKGPVVACYSTAEYLALFEQKHEEAAELYKNVCSRDKDDKSPNAVLMEDGTKAYGPGCFNLAKITMTGQGGVEIDYAKGYKLFDRACRAGHNGACYLQARLLLQKPGTVGGKGDDSQLPYDPYKAEELLERNCRSQIGDSVSCFTLTDLLLRGDKVNMGADNVTPGEARGLDPIQQRQNEPNRSSDASDEEAPVFVFPRNAKKAAEMLQHACDRGSHVTSCHNLAVMYKHGDDGVPPNEEKAKYYARKTESMADQFGGF